MDANYEESLSEMEMIIRKMPFHVCCFTVPPEFGKSWYDVSRAVRDARLPMTPISVVKVLCQHASTSLPSDVITGIVKRLNLKLVATQRRTWHVIKLSEKISDEPFNVLMTLLPSKVMQVMQNNKSRRFEEPEVQTVQLGDLVYISIQMMSESREESILFIATPPGEPVALVSSLNSSLLKASVEGIGYNKFEDASLNGRSVYTLLRKYRTNYHEHADFLTSLIKYNIVPIAPTNGIDLPSRNEMNVSQVLGPDPPRCLSLPRRSSLIWEDNEKEME